MSRYIDLEEFAKRIKKYVKPNTSEEKELIDWCTDECVRLGYAMLTTDVQEVKHGKWLAYRFNLEVVRCSICGAVYEGGDSFRFCPKCGAKMDGDEPIDGLKGEHK